MKKTSNWFATTLISAAMGLAALPVAAADIFEIRPFLRNTDPLLQLHEYVPSVDTVNRANVPYATAESPLEAGKQLFFNVRLVARTDDVPRGQPAGRFQLDYAGSGSRETDWAVNPPMIGIFVGDTLKYARMVQAPTIMPYNYYDASYGNTLYLYDMVFRYTVEPGDLGLPIRLALRNGKPVTSDYDDPSASAPVTEYLMKNVGMFVSSDPWRINYYAEGSTTPSAEKVVFSYAPSRQEPDYKKKDGTHETENPAQNYCLFSNFSLAECGFYTQTVDFDRDEERNPGWRTVREGKTNQTSIEIIDGEMFATNAIPETTLYVWAVSPDWLASGEKPVVTTWDPEPAVEVVGRDETITIGLDDKGDPIWRPVKMATVTIKEHTLYANFSIKGLKKDKKSTLIMSSSDDFHYNSAVGYTLDKDFITCEVACVEGQPELMLKLTEKTDIYTVTSDYTNTLTTMKLTLTDAYDEEINVTITPNLTKPGTYKWKDVVHISDSTDPRTGWRPAVPLVVTIPKGSTASYPVYLYGMGASADQNLWTDGLGQEVTFTLEPDKGETFIKKTTADSLYARPADPVVANKAELETMAISGGDVLPITMRDNYTDVHDTASGYVVYAMWWNDGEEPPQDPKFKNEAFALTTVDGRYARFTPDADGMLTALDDAGKMVADELPAVPGEARGDNLRLRITAPNTGKTTFVDIAVAAKPKAEASAYETKSGDYRPDSFPEVDEASEATLAYIGVTLEGGNKSGGDLYAFLRLKDEAQADLVSGRCLISGGKAPQGIRIRSNESKEYARGELKLLDGIQDGTLLEFDVVLCTTKSYDATKVYSKFDTTTALEILVDNVKPRVNNVSMSGWNLDETGKAFEGEATKDVDQYFTFDIGDAVRDLEATGGEAFALTYQFKGCSPKYTKSVTYRGNPADLIVTNKFATTGTGTLSVTLLDKDGGKTGPLSYTFEVTDKPTITISNRDNIQTFYEDESPEYQVKLLQNPSDENLTVLLTVTPQATGAKAGEIKLGGDFRQTGANTYIAVYEPGITEHSFYVASADGTAGGASKFSFKAEVTTPEFVPGTETPWSEFFSKGILSPISVVNAKPTLTIDGRVCRAMRDLSGESDDIIYLNSSNAPIQVAIGEADPITWSADDVENDLKAGIKVTIVDQYGSHPNTVYNTDDQTFTPSFKYAGPTTVTFTGTDKDGGSITAVRFYTIKATRQLNLTAVGPSDGNGSPHANYYRGAGRGQGHVYADAKCTGALAFSFDYNCGLAASVRATAQGYRVGDIDNGTLTKNGSMGDIPITPEGKLATGEPYFPYEGNRDSFFYVWVRDVMDADGKYTSEIYGDVSPEVKMAASATFTMPTEVDKETGAYPLSQYEAIFSKEFLWTDNIGDINADAIPDIYALGYKGFGVSGEDKTDMNNLGQYNDDGDYFPFVFSDAQGASVFMPSNNWVANSKKFTARLEIRGWGDHLNNAYQVLAAQGYAGSIPEYVATNVYTNPAVDPNSTLTAVEYDAWVQAGRDPSWSPERPTDPTVADTDGDNMPDGYEYYIWYKAHVGWIENGEHKYLTGRKYNPSNPYAPIEITSETIAAAFDPLTRSGSDWDTRDTDDDGLTDYAEYILGTDPFNYDTDNDGLPDGYEVVFTETDPLKADSNNNGVTDGAENPDNDSIAEISKNMLLVSALGESGTEYYCCDGAAPDDYTVTVSETPHNGTAFKVGAVTLVTTRDWASSTYTNDNNEVCLGAGFSARNTWKCKEVEDKLVRAAEPTAAQMRMGTVVTDIQEDAEFYDQNLAAAGETTNGTWYVAYPYAGGYARGKSTSFAAISQKVVLHTGDMAHLETTGIKLLHYQVYQAKGFHSSTGWIHPTAGGVDTRSFTSMDEFLSMVFFHKTGTLSAEQMAVTPEHSRVWIWQHYSTHPKNADTDGDMMPDGWEFYVMSNTGDKGPTWHYSPLYNFALIPDGATRDNDIDLLQWPEEYSGTSSSSRYGWTPLKPTWRNKAEPTDPWDPDTDEDGIKDGHEGGYGDSGLGAIVAANFMYNTTGTSGGGLNPLTWDTDGDGLPDPWELEFHGTYTPGSSTTVVTQTTSVGDDGTTNNVTRAVTTTVGCTWNMDGMNGTVTDAHVDYDHDGLVNWQEYMVGTMRCWRYDDPESTWGMHHASEEELDAILRMGPGTEEWNTYWGERLVNKGGEKYNPHFANGYFDAGAAYFSCCRKDFDPCKGDYFYFADGVYHEQATDFTWSEKASLEFGGKMPYIQFAPLRYISCDPRNSDTDFDGMDDYYELFHGMNPLLGEPGVGYNGRQAYDVVYDAYNRLFYGSASESAMGISALNNWWCNSVKPHSTGMATGIKHAEIGGYDFVAYPWLNGIAGADPDGDNIVNQEESIMPNVQAASTYHHTDPTPLWMTDSSYTNSLTRRYYRVKAPQGENDLSLWVQPLATEPTFVWDKKTYKLSDFPCFSWKKPAGAIYGTLTFEYNLDASFGSYAWYFGFEENEGYDSDHDYLSDYEEGQGKTKSASDPQNHDDPIRRQAMYFNGVDAFLETPVATREWDPDPSDTSTEARQNFLYYTVECWAKPDAESLKNDNAVRTLVERAIWADNASAADETLMRKNFLIGVKGGRWYTCFDSSGTDIQPVEVTDGPVATTNWTHLAATYDGTALRLYVNGVCKNIKTTSIQPEHGVAALAIDKAGEMNPAGGTLGHATDEHDESFIAILVGASAKTKNGIVFDSAWRYRNYLYASEENPQGLYTNATTFADYHNFYKGYIDEVRIWDGARSDAELRADYENRTRYTAELAELNREDVYAKWCEGGLRSPASSVQLPPQLMYHWSFDQIAGAISPEDVIKVPAGFDTAKNVLNAKARWSRPADYEAFDWASSAVRSTVYSDNAWVPWINNTVAHLPRFDLTTLDSIYWSDDYAGNVAAGSYGYSDFQFPRTAEVYSRWTQRTYGGPLEYYCIYLDPDFALLNGVNPARGVALAYTCALTDWRSRWDVVSGYGSYHISPKTKDADALITAKALALRFAFRDRNTCGDDILPMGGAYPRRISATDGGMWDAKPNEKPVAADAWAETGNDADNNGLPDWWEEYARANYCEGLSPEDPLNWDTTVNYYGLKIPAYQAYLRDLAKGMVKIGSSVSIPKDAEGKAKYADTRDMDGDNIPDWWEDMFDIDTGSAADAKADPDNDGLSNYQEYLISEVQGWYAVNPNLAHSAIDQDVTDYFLRLPDGRYYGEAVEIKADHDFMEDNLEDQIGTDRTKYDPYSDYDEDGWGAWSELRYSTYKQPIAARLVSHLVGEEEVRDFPIPVIHATLRYNGEKTLSGTNTAIRIEAYAGDDLTKQPAATFHAQPGAAETRYYNLGFYDDRVIHGTLTPGHLAAGVNNVSLQKAFVQSDDLFTWTVVDVGVDYTNATIHTGSYADMRKAIQTAGGNSYVYVSEEQFAWSDVIYTPTGNNAMSLTVNDQTQTGHFMLATGERLGTVDLTTGDFTFDFSVLKDLYMGTSLVSFQQYYFRIAYKTVLPTMQTRKFQVSLAEPDTGSLTEGSTTFVAYMDVDGNGAFTPETDPIGFAKGVNVSWDNVPELAIEMTDYSLAAGKRFAFDPGADTVRIVRTTMNGSETVNDKTVKRRVVYSRNAQDVDRKNVWEGDLISGERFGLDWRNLQTDIREMGVDIADIHTVDYVVVTNTGSVHNIDPNAIIDAFSVEYSPEAPLPSCVSPTSANAPIVESVRPTFQWSASSDATAFQLQVGDTSGTNWFYKTGIAKLPARDVNGNYVFTAPLFVNDVASGDAWSLANNANYRWRVMMYNAKFSSETGNRWSETGSFTTQVATSNDFSTAYGCAKVSVAYYGPATNDLADVIVQLYKTADFTGTPAAQTRLANVSGKVGSLTTPQVVSFAGLEPGAYYAVAFIDRPDSPDTLGSRDKFETWGYAAQVDFGTDAIWTPNAAIVDASNAKIPTVALIMEDTDLNQNDVLDWKDDVKYLKAATKQTSDDTSDLDKDGLTGKEEIGETYTDPYKPDTDGDGMRDGWEERFAGTDALLPDADTVMAGDVMAYAEMDARLITVAVNGSTVNYLLDEDQVTGAISAGDDIPVTWLLTTYAYPTVEGEDESMVTRKLYGVGTNLTGSATVHVSAEPESVTAVLVHDQVYRQFGFNSKTCVVGDDAVNTKAFTALDKYLVIRYRDSQGLITIPDKYKSEYTSGEDYVNGERLWAQHSLKPLNKDNDVDGIQDGWELYVGLDPFQPNGYYDARQKSAGGEGLTNLQEYDGGHYPTDPNNGDTDGDNVSDKYAYQYHLKGGDAGLDNDGDGLSNYAEYLISEVFKFAQLDPDNPKTDGSCVDYFRKDGALYFGEMFTDHDQVNDVWEQKYNAFANRGVYDPQRDADGDGWSNWAEAKAGTHPGTATAPGVDGETLAEYPIPTIAATIVYNGATPLTGNMVFQAWSEASDPQMTGAPDAAWVSSSETGGTNVTKYVGLNPGKEMTYHLGTGVIQPGSLRVWFRDTAAVNVATYSNGTVAVSTATNPQWYYFVADSQKDNEMGDLLLCVTNQAAVKVGTVDYSAGLVTIDFGSDALQQPVEDVWINGQDASGAAKSTGIASTAVRIDLKRSFVKLAWTPEMPESGTITTYYLSDCAADVANFGAVSEGKNKFIVFCDNVEENFKWDPGEPFGFVQDVDVGWQGGAFTVELTEVSPVFARVNLLAAMGTAATDRQYYQAKDSAVVDVTENDTEEPVKSYLKKLKAIGGSPYDEALTAEDGLTRVRVVRAFVDGDYILGKAKGGTSDVLVGKSVVMDKTLNLNARSYLHEGDFLTDGAHDVGWYSLRSDVYDREVYGDDGTTRKMIEGTNITYMIVLGEGPIAETATSSNLVFRCLINKQYDASIARYPGYQNAIQPVIDTTTPGIVYGTNPTFCWVMQDKAGTDYNSYTAFEVVITGNGISYSSGVRDLPPAVRVGDGIWYSWTLDEPIETVVGATAGKYSWKVAMYNAKYTPEASQKPEVAAWSSSGSLVVNLNEQQPMNDHAYSTIAAAVKYAGPSAVLARSPKVYLQAFRTADFAGAPVGATVIDDFDELIDTSHIVANGYVHGLFQTGTYYLRAFIDSNNNGVKDDFESWGAAADPVTITDLTVTVPTVGIYIEDADTDGDWIPDAYEYAKHKNLTSMNGDVIGDNQIVFSGTLFTVGDAGISRGLSGASLTIFENQSFIKTTLGLTDAVSIEDIRAAVEKRINPKTVKITSLTLAPDGKTVTLSVAAEVTDSIAGQLLGKVYDMTSLVTESVDVTLKVYRKATLAEAGWGEPVCTKTARIGRNNVQVDVPVEGIDMTSGFYKIEIEQK